jgi:hypothetical protein
MRHALRKRSDPAQPTRVHLCRETKLAGFVLTSPSFDEGGEIPIRHTCDGADISPELNWQGAPRGTVALALVVDDPDAARPARCAKDFSRTTSPSRVATTSAGPAGAGPVPRAARITTVSRCGRCHHGSD